MPTTERRSDRASRNLSRALRELGDEVRGARLSAGLSQAAVANAVGVSHAQISRLERARLPRVAVADLVKAAAVVGLDLSFRAYPAGQPLRDRAHLDLPAKLRSVLAPSLTWEEEVPLPIVGDPRAWDAVIRGAGATIGVEAETRLHDIQALQRRIGLKQRDSRMTRVILLLSDSRTNRDFIAAANLGATFPIPGRAALHALANGRDPGGSAIVLR